MLTKTWQQNILVALTYIAAAKFCQQFAIEPGNITPVWLASGLSAAWVFRFGYVLLPGVGLGAAVGNFTGYILSDSQLFIGLPVMAAALNGVGDMCCVFLTVWMAKSGAPGYGCFSDVGKTLRFVFVGGILASLVSGVFGVGGLAAAGMLPMNQAPIALATWTVGDLMGILWIFPLAEFLFRERFFYKDLGFSRLLKPVVTYIGLIGILTSALLYADLRWGFALFSLIFPVAILGTIWIGQLWTVVGFLVVSPISLWLNVTLSQVVTDLPFVLLQCQITLFAMTVCQLIYMGASNHTKQIYDAVGAAKDDFMAKMCHEIRTPMTGIIGNVEHLLEEESPGDQSEVNEVLEAVHKSCHVMLGLLNHMLDFSKLDNHKETYNKEILNVEEICRDQLELYRVNCQRKNLDLIFEKQEGLASHWHTDDLKLKQVLNNLVGNAVKFTSEGQITIRMKKPSSKGGLLIEVEDSGVGMNSEELEKVFEPFWQADSSSTSKTTGTGLGLAITFQLVKVIHGRIEAESTPLKGTIFKVWLDTQAAKPHHASFPPSA